MWIKENLAYEQLSTIDCGDHEIIWLSVNLQGRKKLVLGGLYRPGSHSCFTPGVWRNGGRELDFPLSSCCYAHGPLNAHGAAIFHKEMLVLTFFLGR